MTHSEFNAYASELAHFLQIWIVPDRHGREPSYEQKTIPDPDKRGTLRLIAGPRAGASVVNLHQDVCLYSVLLEREQEVVHELRPERHAWVQVARGAVTLDGQPCGTGTAPLSVRSPRSGSSVSSSRRCWCSTSRD